MKDFNYFSDREQASQAQFRGLRDRLLNPFIRCFIFCRVTPDHLSLLSLSLLVPAGIVLVRDSSPSSALVAAILVILHVLIDGLDGPLARATGKSGAAGSLTDMCVDHCGLLAVACLLPAGGLADGAMSAAYASSYTLAIVFTIWLNVIGRPFAVVVRTKYFLYGLLLWYGVGGQNLLDQVLPVFVLIHVVSAIAGFLRVRRFLSETNEPKEAVDP